MTGLRSQRMAFQSGNLVAHGAVRKKDECNNLMGCKARRATGGRGPGANRTWCPGEEPNGQPAK